MHVVNLITMEAKEKDLSPITIGGELALLSSPVKSLSAAITWVTDAAIRSCCRYCVMRKSGRRRVTAAAIGHGVTAVR